MTPMAERKKPSAKAPKKKHPTMELGAKSKAKSKAKGKAKAQQVPSTPKGGVPREISRGIGDDDGDDDLHHPLPIDIETTGTVFHFSRRSMLRIVQQVGFFMRDQDHVVETVL